MDWKLPNTGELLSFTEMEMSFKLSGESPPLTSAAFSAPRRRLGVDVDAYVNGRTREEMK